MAMVDVANKALSYLGEDTIISFNDDSEQARVINKHYDLCRNTLLQGHNWNFATVRASLTAGKRSYRPSVSLRLRNPRKLP